MPTVKKTLFFYKRGGGDKPVYKKLCCKFGMLPFGNMEFEWKGTSKALMVHFEGKTGTY